MDLNATVPITLKPHDHKKVSLKTQTLHTVEFDFTTMWDFIKKILQKKLTNTTQKYCNTTNSNVPFFFTLNFLI